MAIVLSQLAEPNLFVNPQIVQTRTPDRKELIVLSGVAIVGYRGTSQQWTRDKLQLMLNLPLAPNKLLVVEQHAAFLTLNAASDENGPDNGGYAVDSSYLLRTEDGVKLATIEGDIAARDGAWLLRVGYHAILVGHLVDSPG
jgi:hypothetical protein